MMFSSHGEFSLRWQQNILLMELQGSFNLEGVLSTNDKAIKQIENQNFDQWQMLITLAEETLLVWDSMPDARSFFQRCSENGCQAIAYRITDEVQQATIIKIFELLSLEFRCFYEKDEALEWLKTFGTI